MCVECSDTGILCSAPEGESIYCESCVRGLTLAIRTLGAHLQADQAWLARQQVEGRGCEWEKLVFDCELKEYERLEQLLRERRYAGEYVEMGGC